jgi:hypothetical protein
MRRFIVIPGLVLGLNACLVEHAFAQELVDPAPRQGYYVGLGLNGGGYFVDADKAGSLGGGPGMGFALRLGEMVNDWLGFGFLFSGNLGFLPEFGTFHGGLSIESQFTPFGDPNLALRFASGIAGLTTNRNDPLLARPDDPEGAVGPLVTFGVSYDLFPFGWDTMEGGGTALGFVAEGQVLPGDGALIAGFFVGIEFTYWIGLPDTQVRKPNL